MAKKKTQKEGKILNHKKELPVDVSGLKDDKQWEMKTVGAESQTKLEADRGEGPAITLRHFYFKPNPETFHKQQPTSQQLFNTHIKQIEVELWRDGWKIYQDVDPRLMMAKDKSHYVFVVAAVPGKGQILSHDTQPKTLSEIAHGR